MCASRCWLMFALKRIIVMNIIAINQFFNSSGFISFLPFFSVIHIIGALIFEIFNSKCQVTTHACRNRLLSNKSYPC